MDPAILENRIALFLITMDIYIGLYKSVSLRTTRLVLHHYGGSHAGCDVGSTHTKDSGHNYNWGRIGREQLRLPG